MEKGVGYHKLIPSEALSEHILSLRDMYGKVFPQGPT